ncbi:glycosyltransferase involved in cell wall biosynthesis [Pedobacter sp. UYEF25]
METLPLVTCLMPTFNRRSFVPYAIKYFLRQGYSNKELIVIDDGEDCVEDLMPAYENIKYVRLTTRITLGAKLNMGCSSASGSIIMHWDDDDWYAPHRIDYQVSQLKKNRSEICGINQLIYLDVRSNRGFEYKYPTSEPKWLLGSTLCYERSRWARNMFKEINVGMDGLFVWNTPQEKVTVLENKSMSVHLIHHDNISPKDTRNERWHDYSLAKIKSIMKEDFEEYLPTANTTLPRRMLTLEHESVVPHTKKQIKNIYACLVHEQLDCVIDMVRNLHFNDPDSTILIFSSTASLRLEKSSFPFDQFGAVIYPQILTVEHGYLHNFALTCMQFALENFSFDILTIVDSDQLSVQPGYAGFMGQFFSTQSNVGLLSNRPERITENCVDVFTSIQAFKEYNLWKPLLKTFPNGEEKFVHWSFWPSTVFTFEAIKDLLTLFDTNRLLKDIMCQTKIWATEEIILPTLISLLGYDIKLNPCAHDLVNYRRNYEIHELTKAFENPNAFWVHPINRRYDDGLRKHTRKMLNDYHKPVADEETVEMEMNVLNPRKVLADVREIAGWLSDAEADLLLGYCLKACQNFPEAAIVEVGSYQGKATIVLASVAASVSTKIKVYSIDPHDGILGSADQGLHLFEPTLNQFEANIEKAKLTGVVISLVNNAKNVSWSTPISLLLIDGLHDYLNICDDFTPFSAHIEIGGFLAFHDYADFFPDVMAFVNELTAKKSYIKLRLAHSLIVLQKIR